MIKYAFIFFGIMVMGLMVNATSITTPIFTEERIFKLAHDVVVGNVVDVVEIGAGKSNCLTGMIKLKVSKSFAGQFKHSQLVELGFTHSSLLPKMGDKYFAVINTKSDSFYSGCKNPKFDKYEGSFKAENIFLVYRNDYGRLFEGDNEQNFEFNSCQPNIGFLYQSKIKDSQLSTWKSKDGKTCKKLVGNYEELKSLIMTDFPKRSDQQGSGGYPGVVQSEAQERKKIRTPTN